MVTFTWMRSTNLAVRAKNYFTLNAFLESAGWRMVDELKPPYYKSSIVAEPQNPEQPFRDVQILRDIAPFVEPDNPEKEAEIFLQRQEEGETWVHFLYKDGKVTIVGTPFAWTAEGDLR